MMSKVEFILVALAITALAGIMFWLFYKAGEWDATHPDHLKIRTFYVQPDYET